MNLDAEIKLDYNGTVSIADEKSTVGTTYLSEDATSVLSSDGNFKYSLTYTIDILKYSSTSSEKLIDSLFTEHVTSGSDSVNVSLPYDGHFTVDHVVLPTKAWLEAVIEECNNNDYNLFEESSGYFTVNFTNGIYIVDTETYSTPVILKVTLGTTEDGRNVDLDKCTFTNLVITLGSEFDNLISSISDIDKSTISLQSFNVFSISRLKDCYVKASQTILNQVPKCGKISDSDRFNRDFLWMTINVINIWLEKEEYDMAQVILERLGCYNFCPDILESETKTNDCGCGK